ncbi:MAG: DUF2791 family P-loop domain-containing protein [Leptospiraceae bacterium]|nr:DUF2791 family P-loop domain-containing protein [Leptospiraceae bacterium]
MNDNTKKMIFEELRKGTVPEEGHQAFAVGIEPVLNELQRNMESVSTGDKKEISNFCEAIMGVENFYF